MKIYVIKNKKRLRVVIVSIALALGIPLICGAVVVNHYLNKINYVSAAIHDNSESQDDLNLSDKNAASDEKSTLNGTRINSSSNTATVGEISYSNVENSISAGKNAEEKNEVSMPPKYSSADDDIKKNIEDNRIWYNDKIINILLIGCDNGSSGNLYPRSDAMMIISLNKISKEINIVTLPRATYVAIPGHGNARLNAAYAYGGPDLLIAAIQLNYKIRIDNYISVDFKSFPKIINAIGGVTINLSNEELNFLSKKFAAKGIDISSGAGKYNLDGDLALAYVRARAIDSDKQRTQRQRNVIVEIISMEKSASVSQINDFLDVLLPLVSTNLTKDQIVSEAAKGMLFYKNWPVIESTIPHKGTNLVMVDGFEVLIFDWNVVKSDIHEQLYHGIEPSEPLN